MDSLFKLAIVLSYFFSGSLCAAQTSALSPSKCHLSSPPWLEMKEVNYKVRADVPGIYLPKFELQANFHQGAIVADETDIGRDGKVSAQFKGNNTWRINNGAYTEESAGAASDLKEIIYSNFKYCCTQTDCVPISSGLRSFRTSFDKSEVVTVRTTGKSVKFTPTAVQIAASQASQDDSREEGDAGSPKKKHTRHLTKVKKYSETSEENGGSAPQQAPRGF